MNRPEFVLLFREVLDECDKAEAVIYGYIHWLTQLKNERCTASNETLANLAKTTPGTVAVLLTRLEEKGFIHRIYVDDQPTKGRLEIIPLLTTVKRGINPGSKGVLTPVKQSESIEEEHITAEVVTSVSADEDGAARSEGGKRSAPLKRSPSKPLVDWAVEERGAPFVSITKQMKALDRAAKAKIRAEQLRERWLDMAAEEFWSKRGFDWTNVVASFDRKP